MFVDQPSTPCDSMVRTRRRSVTIVDINKEEPDTERRADPDPDTDTQRAGRRKLGWPKGVLRGSLMKKSTRGPGRPPKV